MPKFFTKNQSYFFSGSDADHSFIQYTPVPKDIALPSSKAGGAFGLVRHFTPVLGAHSALPNYAVKKFLDVNTPLAKVQEECRLWNLAHPYLPAYIAVDGKNIRYIMPRGGVELEDFIKSPLSKEEAVQLAKAVIEAAFHQLWQKGIVHNDLHLRNILVQPDKINGEVHYEVLIIDFGMAKEVSQGANLSNDMRQLGFAITSFFDPEAQKELFEFMLVFKNQAGKIIGDQFEDHQEKVDLINTFDFSESEPEEEVDFLEGSEACNEKVDFFEKLEFELFDEEPESYTEEMDEEELNMMLPCDCDPIENMMPLSNRKRVVKIIRMDDVEVSSWDSQWAFFKSSPLNDEDNENELLNVSYTI